MFTRLQIVQQERFPKCLQQHLPFVTDKSSTQILLNRGYSLPKFKRRRLVHTSIVFCFLLKSLLILIQSLQNDFWDTNYPITTLRLWSGLWSTRCFLLASMICVAIKVMIDQHLDELAWIILERIRLVPVRTTENKNCIKRTKRTGCLSEDWIFPNVIRGS